MIKVSNLDKSFGDKKILNDINFTLKSGEILSIVGDSGSGKTTLSKIILGLIKPDRGQIIYEGVDLVNLGKKDFKKYRKDIQIISQNPSSFFDPSMKLGRSVIEPLKNFKLKLDNEKFKDLIEEFKLDEKVLARYPHQVSGGEIQRLSIIRALLLEPKILILDEPTSMLDISVQAQILDILKRVQVEKNMSYIFISHDMEVVEIFSDRVLNLKSSKLI